MRDVLLCLAIAWFAYQFGKTGMAVALRLWREAKDA